jgi:hypothetical protein
MPDDRRRSRMGPKANPAHIGREGTRAAGEINSSDVNGYQDALRLV